MTRFLFFCFLVVMAAPALASGALSPAVSGDAPLTINAARTLEWHRDEKVYIATGSVTARQGDTQISADRLTARYREGAAKQAGTPAIYELIAEGHVVIESGNGSKGYGDHAVYNLDSKQAVMTGQNLRLEDATQKVTATERFEYYTAEGRAVAIGNAMVETNGDTLKASEITAWLADENGARVMTRAVAKGNVVITTPTETATGSGAEYVRATHIATLAGPVKITREKNVLEGARAEVNLATNISTLFADTKKGGRVTGVFYPNSTKKKQP